MRFPSVLAVWILRFAQDDEGNRSKDGGKGRRTKFFLTQPKKNALQYIRKYVIKLHFLDVF
jgi:hypothetical protein